MTIDKLNELREKSKMFGRDFRIKTFETYPNVHPTLKNPLNHLNDIRVEFSMYDVNIFGVHMLSEMTIKDFLKTKRIKTLQISKETGINPSKLSLFFNSWIQLKEHELKLVSKFLKVSKEELTTNNIKE